METTTEGKGEAWRVWEDPNDRVTICIGSDWDEGCHQFSKEEAATMGALLVAIAKNPTMTLEQIWAEADARKAHYHTVID